MNCEMAEAELLDVVNTDQVSPELQAHLRQCSECASELAALRQTSSVLDGWSVPEPSPYFDTRLYARLREQKSASGNFGWLEWLSSHWQPALVGVLAGALAVGIGLQRSGLILSHNNTEIAADVAPAPPGTAVGDLQALDKNFEVYANFDMLYEGNDEQDSQ